MSRVLRLVALLAFAWLISENRRAVSWRSAAIGVAVTVALALLLLKVPPVRLIFAAANRAVDAIAAATRAGTSLVFGYLGGGALPFDPKFPGSEFVLAFQALPIVLVMSVLTTLLFYWGILPPIVRGFARVLQRAMGVGGAVGLSTAANIFVGMVEAPLFIRYAARLRQPVTQERSLVHPVPLFIVLDEQTAIDQRWQDPRCSQPFSLRLAAESRRDGRQAAFSQPAQWLGLGPR